MNKLTPEEIASQAAKNEPEKYYAEPFTPHNWVISAMKEYAAQEVAEKEGQANTWKEKARRWDLLSEKIQECYGKENDEGEWEESTDENTDLCTIGEIAAAAFGWI